MLHFRTQHFEQPPPDVDKNIKNVGQLKTTLVKFNCHTVKLGYNELGYNEHSVITNKFLSKIGHFSTQINPVITKPGYNEQK